MALRPSLAIFILMQNTVIDTLMFFSNGIYFWFCKRCVEGRLCSECQRPVKISMQKKTAHYQQFKSTPALNVPLHATLLQHYEMNRTDPFPALPLHVNIGHLQKVSWNNTCWGVWSSTAVIATY